MEEERRRHEESMKRMEEERRRADENSRRDLEEQRRSLQNEKEAFLQTTINTISRPVVVQTVSDVCNSGNPVPNAGGLDPYAYSATATNYAGYDGGYNAFAQQQAAESAAYQQTLYQQQQAAEAAAYQQTLYQQQQTAYHPGYTQTTTQTNYYQPQPVVTTTTVSQYAAQPTGTVVEVSVHGKMKKKEMKRLEKGVERVAIASSMGAYTGSPYVDPYAAQQYTVTQQTTMAPQQYAVTQTTTQQGYAQQYAAVTQTTTQQAYVDPYAQQQYSVTQTTQGYGYGSPGYPAPGY